MIVIRRPDTIYQASGRIENGTFQGRWHFSFDRYHDPEYMRFGALRVLNDDTLSPGAVWPLHPHKDNEVVTYCVAGEFRHADEHGTGGILQEGWVQHTTVGRGMWHSEINNRPDTPMRFIQMWFLPDRKGLKPSVEQKPVERSERTNHLYPLVSNLHPGALPIRSDAQVYASYIQKKRTIPHRLEEGRGAYLYVLTGGPSVEVNGRPVSVLGAGKITEESEIRLTAAGDAEILLVDVGLGRD